MRLEWSCLEGDDCLRVTGWSPNALDILRTMTDAEVARRLPVYPTELIGRSFLPVAAGTDGRYAVDTMSVCFVPKYPFLVGHLVHGARPPLALPRRRRRRVRPRRLRARSDRSPASLFRAHDAGARDLPDRGGAPAQPPPVLRALLEPDERRLRRRPRARGGNQYGRAAHGGISPDGTRALGLGAETRDHPLRSCPHQARARAARGSGLRDVRGRAGGVGRRRRLRRRRRSTARVHGVPALRRRR